MKLLVRYCGGCNPQYDRVKLVEELIDGIPCTPVFDSAEPWDCCLLVSGCESACAGKGEDIEPAFAVSGKAETGELREKIRCWAKTLEK